MKIGFFIDLFYPYMLGGIEQRGLDLARHFIDQGDSVTVFTTSLERYGRHEDLYQDGLRIIRTGPIRNPLKHRRQSAFLGFVLSSMGLGKYMDSLDILDVNQFCALSGGLLGRINHKPTAYTIHGTSPKGIMGMYLSLFLRPIKIYETEPIVIAVSSDVKQTLINHLGFKERHVTFLPNPIDYDAIRGQAAEGYHCSTQRILYVDRLEYVKKIDHLILILGELLKSGYDIFLDIIGMGSQKRQLQELTRNLGLEEYITFHGFIPDKKTVYRKMSQADLFVNPSIFEGFGMTLLESMAAGTPVVAYNLGAYKDYITNLHNGILAKKKNPQALKEAIKLALDNPNLRYKLSRNGLKTAKSYDIPKIAKSLKKIYQKAITRR